MSVASFVMEHAYHSDQHQSVKATPPVVAIRDAACGLKAAREAAGWLRPIVILMCGAALYSKRKICDASWSGASHVSGLYEAARMAAGPDEVRRSGSDQINALEAP
jgi:hypothetical protein